MISREKWAEIIKDFHEKGVPDLVERAISIPTEVPLKRAISIIGPRRAGKTYTMFQIIGAILRSKAAINQTIYINFEKTDLEGCNCRDLGAMLETFYELYPENKHKKVWLFLDEIQNAENWEKFVRTVIDNEDIQVFISGSSSKLLSKEIATSMRGRTVSYTLLPFSFTDCLIAEKVELSKYFSSSERAEIINRLGSYLESGGYPEAVLYGKEKEKILQDIIETTIYRDVVERYKIRNIKLLKLLIKSLISSAGKEFSVHKFYNFVKSMGMKAGKNTLYNYLEALNDVFFVFPLRRFSYSYKGAEQSIPKVYLIDNGILSMNGISGRGRLMENLVFVELLRRGKEAHYYKSADGKEVDFVILEKKKVNRLIQACWDMSAYKTKERELKALLKASKDLRCNDLLVITGDLEGGETVEGKKIRYVPLWKWLLEDSRPKPRR